MTDRMMTGSAADSRAAETRSLGAFLLGRRTLAELDGMTALEAQAIAQMGCELAEAGRLDEARVIFEGLLDGNPEDSSARAALGTVYQKLGRIGAAREEYEAALERDPANPVALTGRAELRLRMADRAGAEDLVRAVAVDPRGETAAGRRARALLEALAAFEGSAAPGPPRTGPSVPLPRA